LLVAGRAIVATGSYGPKGFVFKPPQGAEEADASDLIRVVRNQIGQGVDFIKIYADYRWGPFGQAMPSFSLEEIRTIVETARSSGRVVVAHATTKEGMRRAVLGGVSTIEHGDEGDLEIFRLMKEHLVSYCPTLAAGEAILQYSGWKKDTDPLPERIRKKRQSFSEALTSGVQILFGGDVGVFPHGDNARELILMGEYGMRPEEVLRSATSGNADALGLKNRGRIQKGLLADLVGIRGNPIENLNDIYQVDFVMKNGKRVVKSH
jgi:imidazolonepropionase-like amidohydrolase